MKVTQSLLFCLPENKTNPMAPKNIKISATLNAKGFEIPQQDTFRKSKTAPWKNRSTALPAAPPTRKPQEINPIDPKFSETDHLITIKQIKKAITISTQRIISVLFAKRPKFTP